MKPSPIVLSLLLVAVHWQTNATQKNLSITWNKAVKTEFSDPQSRRLLAHRMGKIAQELLSENMLLEIEIFGVDTMGFAAADSYLASKRNWREKREAQRSGPQYHYVTNESGMKISFTYRFSTGSEAIRSGKADIQLNGNDSQLRRVYPFHYQSQGFKNWLIEQEKSL